MLMNTKLSAMNKDGIRFYRLVYMNLDSWARTDSDAICKLTQSNLQQTINTIINRIQTDILILNNWYKLMVSIFQKVLKTCNLIGADFGQ